MNVEVDGEIVEVHLQITCRPKGVGAQDRQLFKVVEKKVLNKVRVDEKRQK